MRDILQNESPRPRRRPQLIAAISVVLIAVLALAGFAWLGPRARQGIATHPKPTAQPTIVQQSPTSPAACKGTPSTTGGVRTATDKDITIHVAAAYADASQTYMTFHITSTSYPPSKLAFAQIAESTLLDAQGRSYATTIGGADTSSASPSYFQMYQPLVPALQKGAQSLTLVVHLSLIHI